LDIKVENKDTVTQSSGYLKRIEGIDEYLQRAYISFIAVKEGFCYQRSLGSLKNLKEIDNIDTLIKEAQSALCDTPEIEIIKAVKEGETVTFTLKTPLGTGEIKI